MISWFKVSRDLTEFHRVKSWFQLQIYWLQRSDLGRAAVVLSYSPDFNLLIYLLRQVRWKSSWNSRRKPMMQVRDLFSSSFITSFLISSNEWNVRNDGFAFNPVRKFTLLFARANTVDCNYGG
jgi:hypothetical protein